jgi:hypothetical protein
MTYDKHIASDYARLRHVHPPLLATLISGSGVVDAIHHFQNRPKVFSETNRPL